MPNHRVAVIGSGIAGLSAAWLLARRYEVTLFEAADYLGGHTHTVEVTVDGITAPVDTGFLVFNDRTYPNLIALFDLLGVPSAASDMSFSVRIEQARVEWAGASLATLFAQKSNLVRPEFWVMLKDVARFNREARALLTCEQTPDESLGEFLDRRRYGRAFRDWYLLPMAGAIWSCPTDQMLAYPAATFLRFFYNHGLLQIHDRPQWRTVRGGGREYVERMAAELPDVQLRTPIVRVRRGAAGVEVTTGTGATRRFDQVVLACHTDQALDLLADADPDERRILGSVRYQPNRVVVHTDASFMPRSREAWSSWNYLAHTARPRMRPVSVSYWLNKLQPLPFHSAVIETLNPNREPRAECVLARFEYAHPMFDGPAIGAQRELPAIQGRHATWYCGAWTGYGFHEDGLRSGIAVANSLGVLAPWQQRDRAAVA
jgi:predicted NAD/FAD-binding protein